MNQRIDSVTNYAVRPLQPHEGQTWDAFVRLSPQGTLFHSTSWLLATGQPYHIFGCFCQEMLVGGMTLISNGSGKVSDCYHYGPYLGLVLLPPSGKYLTNLTNQRNITRALAEYTKNQFQSIFCPMGPDVIDLQQFIWSGYSVRVQYTYRIDLRNLDLAWRNMEDKRRNDIRKAERDGITVRESVNIEDIVPLMAMTYRRQTREPHFISLVTRVWQQIRQSNLGRCFVARDSAGTALSGICVLWDERGAYYFVGGYNPDGHRGAGALSIWHAVRHASTTLGLQRFDFLGSVVQPIERYFRDFGGILTPTFVVTFEHPSLSKNCREVLTKLKILIKGR